MLMLKKKKKGVCIFRWGNDVKDRQLKWNSKKNLVEAWWINLPNLYI